MIKRKAQVGQNCQDNKCQRSSRSTIIIHFGVAANEYSNVVGELFWRDYSFVSHPHSYEISWLGNVHIGIIHVCVSTQMHNLPVLEMAFPISSNGTHFQYCPFFNSTSGNFPFGTVPKLAICHYWYWVWLISYHFRYWPMPFLVQSFTGPLTGTGLYACGLISGTRLFQFRYGRC